MANYDIGIDLGTTSIIVAVAGQGVVLSESSVVAVDSRKNKVLAVGDEDLIKIHFHTNEPWKILEYCNSIGEIYDIVVEDMIRQSAGLKG